MPDMQKRALNERHQQQPTAIVTATATSGGEVTIEEGVTEEVIQKEAGGSTAIDGASLSGWVVYGLSGCLGWLVHF